MKITFKKKLKENNEFSTDLKAMYGDKLKLSPEDKKANKDSKDYVSKELSEADRNAPHVINKKYIRLDSGQVIEPEPDYWDDYETPVSSVAKTPEKTMKPLKVKK